MAGLGANGFAVLSSKSQVVGGTSCVMYNSVCSRAKGSGFCAAGHAIANSRRKNDDNCVRKTIPKGTADFYACSFKALSIATAIPCALFTNIYQKSSRAHARNT